MLNEITVSTIFSVFFVFCRLGSGFLLMPGIGEMYIPVRSRLLFSLLASISLAPVIQHMLPAYPENILTLFFLLLGEITIGLSIGLIARMIISALHTAGMIISFQSGLSAATLFDTTQGGQGSMIGNFLSLFALLLIFSLNLHHLLIYGFAESYTLFAPGIYPATESLAELFSRTLAGSFVVAVKISAPHIVLGLLLFLGAGVLARLMPNMQIFFVIMPLQIFISFAILAMTLAVGMMWFMEYYEATLSGFLFPGETISVR